MNFHYLYLDHPKVFTRDPNCYHCGKVSYPSKRDAHEAANYVMSSRRRKQKSKRLRAYPCFYCKGWHLSSKPKDERQE